MSSSFLRHYDETKTLSYAIPLISPTWSDGIHSAIDGPGLLMKLKNEQGNQMVVGILFPETFPYNCKMVKAVNGLGEDMGERESCARNYLPAMFGSGWFKQSNNAWVMQKPCSHPFVYPVEQKEKYKGP
ncbi:MAG: hypothetical protein P8H57_05595 [Emcibacteraceae bacterium]|nr:hypothetical protein [Emcibacteraceae bacterium]